MLDLKGKLFKRHVLLAYYLVNHLYVDVKTSRCSQDVKSISFVDAGVYSIQLLSVFLLLLTVVVDSFSNKYK